MIYKPHILETLPLYRMEVCLFLVIYVCEIFLVYFLDINQQVHTITYLSTTSIYDIHETRK